VTAIIEDVPPIAIVTGAASGIGRGIAAEFIRAGTRVLTVDRDQELLETVWKDEAARGQVVTLGLDLTADDAPDKVLATCCERLGEPSILINNAGIGNARPALETTDDDLDRYLHINFRSLFRLSREFIRSTKGMNRSIVNIASVFGFVGFPGTAPYSAAKAAVIGLTHQMTADYTVHGVRINAVAPGLIATSATAERMQSNNRFRQLTLDQIPAGRPGTPEDIAAVVLFLCSPGASYICGQVITVDGGWTATRYTASTS
jgi:NAD(P)-dependent dehydrogenase (short-subunit alcohol dehydrogenase family)